MLYASFSSILKTNLISFILSIVICIVNRIIRKRFSHFKKISLRSVRNIGYTAGINVCRNRPKINLPILMPSDVRYCCTSKMYVTVKYRVGYIRCDRSSFNPKSIAGRRKEFVPSIKIRCGVHESRAKLGRTGCCWFFTFYI